MFDDRNGEDMIDTAGFLPLTRLHMAAFALQVLMHNCDLLTISDCSSGPYYPISAFTLHTCPGKPLALKVEYKEH